LSTNNLTETQAKMLAETLRHQQWLEEVS